MLKVTMIIDNKIASPLTPNLFVLKEVISTDRELFDIVEMTVEQEDDFEKLKSHNKNYSKCADEILSYFDKDKSWERPYTSAGKPPVDYRPEEE